MKLTYSQIMAIWSVSEGSICATVETCYGFDGQFFGGIAPQGTLTQCSLLLKYVQAALYQ